MKYYANEKYAEGGLKNDLTIFYTKEAGKFKLISVYEYLNTGELDNDNFYKSYSSKTNISFNCKCLNKYVGCYIHNGTIKEADEICKKNNYNYMIQAKTRYDNNLTIRFNKAFLDGLSGNVRVKIDKGYKSYNQKHDDYILFIDIECMNYSIKPVIISANKYHKTVKNMIVINGQEQENTLFIEPIGTIKLNKGLYVFRELTLLNEDTYKLLALKRIFNSEKIKTIEYVHTTTEEDHLISLMSLNEIRELLNRFLKHREEEAKRIAAKEEAHKLKVKNRCLHFIKRLGQVKALFDSGVIYKRIDKYKEKYNKTLNSLAMLNSRYELNLKDEAIKVNVIY